MSTNHLVYNNDIFIKTIQKAHLKTFLEENHTLTVIFPSK